MTEGFRMRIGSCYTQSGPVANIFNIKDIRADIGITGSG